MAGSPSNPSQPKLVASPSSGALESYPIERIGLVAGQGQFPMLLARAARDRGVHVTGFGLTGFAAPEFADAVDHIEWVELGQFGRLVELLHRLGIQHVSMVGRVPHNSIWQYRHFDVRAVKLLATVMNRRADGILSRICDEFRKEGIEVVDSTMFLRSFMPRAGVLTSCRALSIAEQEDIEFGLPIARAIAGLDIGQSIVVKDKAVVAVEGLEGTDKCLQRAAELCGNGFVLIKVSKPRQDARFDVPVIGLGTIQMMEELGGGVMAISAGETLMFNREEMVERANRAGIVIVAVDNVPPAVPQGLQVPASTT